MSRDPHRGDLEDRQRAPLLGAPRDLDRLGRDDADLPAALLDLSRDRLHAGKCLDPALRLHGLRRLGFETGDEGLEVGANLLLLFHQLEIQALLFPARLLESVVAACVERQPASVQMQDRPHGAVEQISVVADHQNGASHDVAQMLDPRLNGAFLR